MCPLSSQDMPLLLPTLLAAVIPVAFQVQGPHGLVNHAVLQTGNGFTDKQDLLRTARESQHGKIDWYKGSYKELLATAAKENRVVFLNFYTDWCTWCKQLDRDAYSDSKILKALEGALCFSIDAESDEGIPLDTRFPTKSHYPALIFLNSDGSLRDRIGGYMPTYVLLPEIERILADRDTLDDHRRRVQTAPTDLPAIWKYALKLRDLDDLSGYNEQLRMIRQLDPKAKSLTMRRILLQELLEQLEFDLAPAPMIKFLKDETYSEILFEGWHNIAWLERKLALSATAKDDRELAARHMQNYHIAHRRAWPHCPKDERATEGNHLAWELYLDWGALDDEMREFAIKTARESVKAAPDEPNIIDTLACALFSAGQTTEAVQLMRKCVVLQPDRQLWRERLEMFLAKEI